MENYIVSPRLTNISLFSNGLNIDNSGRAAVASQLRARNCDEVSVNADLAKGQVALNRKQRTVIQQLLNNLVFHHLIFS